MPQAMMVWHVRGAGAPSQANSFTQTGADWPMVLPVWGKCAEKEFRSGLGKTTVTLDCYDSAAQEEH